MVRLRVGPGVRKVLGHGAGKVMPQMIHEGQRGKRRQAGPSAVGCAASCVRLRAGQISATMPENKWAGRSFETGRRWAQTSDYCLALYSLGFLHEWNAACNFDFAFGAGQVVGLLAAGRLSKFADGPAGRGPPKSGALNGSVKHYFFAKRSCPIERDGR